MIFYVFKNVKYSFNILQKQVIIIIIIHITFILYCLQRQLTTIIMLHIIMFRCHFCGFA